MYNCKKELFYEVNDCYCIRNKIRENETSRNDV